jgi:asparagine synthase (glutamine-hydrolysing)
VSGFVALLNGNGSLCDVAELRRLTNFLAFRGPDAQQVWAEGPAGLGHALLRTTREAEHEQQPLTVDGRAWIVADARVDGREELISALTRRFDRDQSLSSEAPDAELILRAYLAWGEACVEHILGDFAFVIWEPVRQRFFAARDHFGVKPLFYAKCNGTLLLSNTLDCLRQHPAVSDRLDDLAIADFLLFESVQDPDATAFADIRRLPPAYVLSGADGKISTHRYWQLSVSEPVQYRRSSEYVERFSELLDTAVADRLRAASVGVLMSGGLDSTTVAARAKRIFVRTGNANGVRAHTEVFDRLIPHEERRYSKLTAEFLKVPIEFQVGDDARIFERAEHHTPEPVHTAWPTSIACQLNRVAAHGRVALTGLGADPALSSLLSTHFRDLITKGQLGRAVTDAMRYLGTEDRFSRLYLRTRWRRWFPAKTEHPWRPQWLNPDLERGLNLSDRWNEQTRDVLPTAAVRPIAQMQMAASMWTNLLQGYDSGTTQVPVEVRHPFFDLRLVNFLLALPTVPWCCDKELLRAAAKGVLPEVVRLRRKSPLPADPLLALLQRPESAWVDEFKPTAELGRYVIRKHVPAVFGEHDSWTASINLRPLSLNFWLRSHRCPAIE